MGVLHGVRCDHPGTRGNCPHCGVRQIATPPGEGKTVDQPDRSKFAAALFGIFLGGFGMHKFYLDKTGWGILYLLFCWTFIPAVIELLEGLNYLFMSEKVFQERYGTA